MRNRGYRSSGISSRQRNPQCFPFDMKDFTRMLTITFLSLCLMIWNCKGRKPKRCWMICHQGSADDVWHSYHGACGIQKINALRTLTTESTAVTPKI